MRRQALFKKILFCTDFSKNSHWAFTYALNLRKKYTSKLFILHVTPVPTLPEQLSIYLPSQRLRELMIAQKNELEKELNTHYLRKLREWFDPGSRVLFEGTKEWK